MKDFKSKGILTLILVLASLLLAYFAVASSYKALSTARGELKSVSRDQENLDHSLRQLESFLDQYKTLGKEVEVANSALPTGPQPALLLAEIEELANLSGLAISTVNFIESPESETFKLPTNSIVSVEVQVSVSGSYFSFRDFLNRLEKHIRIIDPQLISIGTEEKNLNYEYEVKFKTYYQK